MNTSSVSSVRLRLLARNPWRLNAPVLAIFLLANATAAAPPPATRFARVFADHMVLQRGEPVAIFGTDTAPPGRTVAIQFAGQRKSAVADATGHWRVTLDALAANPLGQALTATGSATITLTDVVVGEVWLAAGQSNMNFPIKQSVTHPNAADFPRVRMCNWESTVGTNATQVYGPADFGKLTAERFYSGTWETMDAKTITSQSAVAWFFASDLAAALKGTGPQGSDVPVGIVECAVGGTGTEAFIPPAAQLADAALKGPFQHPRTAPELGQWITARISRNLTGYTHRDANTPFPHPYAPGFLYQNGIALIAPFTFKGVIWYQGESNAEFTDPGFARDGKWISDYQLHVMQTLVTSWRTAFGKPQLPFYQVELPRIRDANRAMWPWYRDAQQRLAATTDGVETAVITEFGTDGPNVHPPNKEPVGHRLARIARAKLYGESTLEFSGPRCKQQTVASNKIILEFTHTGGGLASRDGAPLRAFEIAGPDRKFHPATATIAGNTVEVTAPDVPSPVAVRFAWSMNPDVNFANRNGNTYLSAPPFRTDNWPDTQ